MAEGLSPVAPLTIDSKDGIKLNKNYHDLVVQNLKMLLLTSPGERIMIPDFGCGVRRFLFEMDHPSTYGTLSGIIYKQASRWLPYLEILDIKFASQGAGDHTVPANTIQIKIIFNIKPLNRRSELEVSVS
mgnify:CR=1 FL=1|jgi:phage baseplate assembly protein W